MSIGASTENAMRQLRLLKNDDPLTRPEYLSERVKTKGRAGELTELIRIIQSQRSGWGSATSYIAGLIDIHHGLARR